MKSQISTVRLHYFSLGKLLHEELVCRKNKIVEKRMKVKVTLHAQAKTIQLEMKTFSCVFEVNHDREHGREYLLLC